MRRVVIILIAILVTAITLYIFAFRDSGRDSTRGHLVHRTIQAGEEVKSGGRRPHGSVC